MEQVLDKLLDAEILFWLVGGVVGIIGIIAGVANSTLKSMAKERSRREIAAYIAEGSMTPEQGLRLMAAGEPKQNA